MSKPRNPIAHKRRLALKTLSGSALLGGLADASTALWQRPLVQSAVLPAHAQTSPAAQPMLQVGDLTLHYYGRAADNTIQTGTVSMGENGVVRMVAYETPIRVLVISQTPPAPTPAQTQGPDLAETLFPAAYAQETQGLSLNADLELTINNQGQAVGNLPLTYRDAVVRIPQTCMVPISIQFSSDRSQLLTLNLDTNNAQCNGYYQISALRVQGAFGALPPASPLVQIGEDLTLYYYGRAADNTIQAGAVSMGENGAARTVDYEAPISVLVISQTPPSPGPAQSHAPDLVEALFPAAYAQQMQGLSLANDLELTIDNLGQAAGDLLLTYIEAEGGQPQTCVMPVSAQFSSNYSQLQTLSLDADNALCNGSYSIGELNVQGAFAASPEAGEGGLDGVRLAVFDRPGGVRQSAVLELPTDLQQNEAGQITDLMLMNPSPSPSNTGQASSARGGFFPAAYAQTTEFNLQLDDESVNINGLMLVFTPGSYKATGTLSLAYGNGQICDLVLEATLSEDRTQLHSITIVHRLNCGSGEILPVSAEGFEAADVFFDINVPAPPPEQRIRIAAFRHDRLVSNPLTIPYRVDIDADNEITGIFMEREQTQEPMADGDLRLVQDVIFDFTQGQNELAQEISIGFGDGGICGFNLRVTLDENRRMITGFQIPDQADASIFGSCGNRELRLLGLDDLNVVNTAGPPVEPERYIDLVATRQNQLTSRLLRIPYTLERDLRQRIIGMGHDAGAQEIPSDGAGLTWTWEPDQRAVSFTYSPDQPGRLTGTIRGLQLPGAATGQANPPALIDVAIDFTIHLARDFTEPESITLDSPPQPEGDNAEDTLHYVLSLHGEGFSTAHFLPPRSATEERELDLVPGGNFVEYIRPNPPQWLYMAAYHRTGDGRISPIIALPLDTLTNAQGEILRISIPPTVGADPNQAPPYQNLEVPYGAVFELFDPISGLWWDQIGNGEKPETELTLRYGYSYFSIILVLDRADETDRTRLNAHLTGHQNDDARFIITKGNDFKDANLGQEEGNVDTSRLAVPLHIRVRDWRIELGAEDAHFAFAPPALRVRFTGPHPEAAEGASLSIPIQAERVTEQPNPIEVEIGVRFNTTARNSDWAFAAGNQNYITSREENARRRFTLTVPPGDPGVNVDFMLVLDFSASDRTREDRPPILVLEIPFPENLEAAGYEPDAYHYFRNITITNQTPPPPPPPPTLGERSFNWQWSAGSLAMRGTFTTNPDRPVPAGNRITAADVQSASCWAEQGGTVLFVIDLVAGQLTTHNYGGDSGVTPVAGDPVVDTDVSVNHAFTYTLGNNNMDAFNGNIGERIDFSVGNRVSNQFTGFAYERGHILYGLRLVEQQRAGGGTSFSMGGGSLVSVSEGRPLQVPTS